MNKKRIIVDADPATGVPFKDVDDGLAILLLLASPEISLEGLTINFGNVNATLGCKIAKDVLAIIGEKIPVVQGAEKRDDLGKSNPAVDFLIETVRKNPGEITLLAIAPLTNVATAMMLDDSFAKNLKDLVVMGGALKFKGFSYFGEFNFHLGGMATSTVISAPIPKTVITMDLCSQAVFRQGHLAQFKENAGSAVSRYLALNIEPWLNLNRKIFFRKKGFFPWDVVAAAYLIDETLFDKNPVTFSVRTEGSRSGSIFAFRNLADFAGADNVVPINMPRTLKVDKFMEIFINRLLKL